MSCFKFMFSPALLFFLMIGATATAKWPIGTKPFARAILSPKSGSSATGTVDFAKSKNGLLVRAYLNQVSPGNHGFHIHEKGDCGAPDASSAGGHYNPTLSHHGGPASADHHAGDLGNVVADKSGKALLEIVIPQPSSLAFPGWDDIVGKSVVLHEKQDDLVSQPAGNSGKRIACGVIHAVAPLAE